MFTLVKNGDLCYYTIDSFTKTGLVKHCFTTRKGGVSTGCYDSMNLRMNCDDSRDNINKNYEIICDELGISTGSLVLSKQVHDVCIKDVTHKDCGNGFLYENRFESADALVTAEKGVTLVTFYADCVPVFLLDKRLGVLALIHSGWKGTVGKISTLTFRHMQDVYGSKSEDIVAAIGPSIRACHFEVGDEVCEIFRENFGDEFVINGFSKPHIDLQGCIKSGLSECGIKDITDSGICTYCNNDLFYSHRKTGAQRGSMAAFAQLV
jgi:hypothetical protein